MKRIIYIILLGFIFSSEVKNLNGNDWKSWNFSNKIGYVNGFFDGFETYETLLDETIDMEIKRDPYWLHPLVITILNDNSRNYTDAISKFDSIELSKRLDAFYYEPDNYGISIVNAMKILNLRELGSGKEADTFLLECQKKYLKGK